VAGAAEVRAADLTKHEQTVDAVAGSDVVFLLAGLKYDHKLWAGMWPRIIDNTVDACKRARARLVFFDNVYMYGRVKGPMTEETPFEPTSAKGEVRAEIATSLINEWKAGELTAMIARSADFYGPGAKNGIPNSLVCDPVSKGQKAMCLVSDAQPHSYTYVPDAAQALLTLAESPTAWNQTWHLPTAPQPPTSKEFIQAAAEAMGVSPKYRVLSRTMVRLVGMFNPLVREVHEMLYQNDSPYLFDSSKYARTFGFSGTPYADGIRKTAASYKR
jgi:nucleoside-diphosphate-sugar epimerase